MVVPLPCHSGGHQGDQPGALAQSDKDRGGQAGLQVLVVPCLLSLTGRVRAHMAVVEGFLCRLPLGKGVPENTKA